MYNNFMKIESILLKRKVYNNFMRLSQNFCTPLFRNIPDLMPYKMDVSKITFWFICELNGSCNLILFPNAYYRSFFSVSLARLYLVYFVLELLMYVSEYPTRFFFNYSPSLFLLCDLHNTCH